MDPNHAAIFRAINKPKGGEEALKEALSLTPHGAWVLNEQNQSAFDYALAIGDSDSINVMLSVMRENVQNLLPTIVHEQILDFALFQCVRHFSEEFADLTAFKRFYDEPETYFTFLESTGQGWADWASTISSSTQAASNAVTEALKIKPKIHRMIRAHAFNRVLSANLMSCPYGDENTLKELRELCKGWRSQPIFSEHRNPGAVLMGPTESVTTLGTMITAANILLENTTDIPENITLEQAQQILTLCAKSYPSSPRSLQDYWHGLTEDLFKIFSHEPDSIKKLYDTLLDPHWLFTKKDIPFTEMHLVHSLSKETVAKVLEVYVHNDNYLALLHDKPLSLYPGKGMEILTLHSAFADLKHINLTEVKLDEQSQAVMHAAMMNNPAIHISAPNDRLFDENPFQHYPQSSCKMILHISNAAQLIAFDRQMIEFARVQPHVFCSIPHRLLQEAGALTALQNIQQSLGPQQTVSVDITDDNKPPRVIADMIFGRDSISPGKLTKANAKKNPAAFFTLYKKFPWSVYAGKDSVNHNLSHNLALFFIVSRRDYKPEIFAEIQNKLTDKNPTCYIRVDNLDFAPDKDGNIPTHCDFIVKKNLVKPGPLLSANLCTEPSLFADANPVAKPVLMVKGKAPAAIANQAPPNTVAQHTIKHG